MNTCLHVLLYRQTRSSSHRQSNRHFGDSLYLSLKSQETYSNRLDLYLDKVGNPPSEADQALSLKNKDSAKPSEQVGDRHRADLDTHIQPQDTVNSPAKHGDISERRYPRFRKDLIVDLHAVALAM